MHHIVILLVASPSYENPVSLKIHLFMVSEEKQPVFSFVTVHFTANPRGVLE